MGRNRINRGSDQRNLLTTKAEEYWQWLPREVVQSPPLEVFRP